MAGPSWYGTIFINGATLQTAHLNPLTFKDEPPYTKEVFKQFTRIPQLRKVMSKERQIEHVVETVDNALAFFEAGVLPKSFMHRMMDLDHPKGRSHIPSGIVPADKFISVGYCGHCQLATTLLYSIWSTVSVHGRYARYLQRSVERIERDDQVFPTHLAILGVQIKKEVDILSLTMPCLKITLRKRLVPFEEEKKVGCIQCLVSDRIIENLETFLKLYDEFMEQINMALGPAASDEETNQTILREQRDLNLSTVKTIFKSTLCYRRCPGAMTKDEPPRKIHECSPECRGRTCRSTEKDPEPQAVPQETPEFEQQLEDHVIRVVRTRWLSMVGTKDLKPTVTTRWKTMKAY